MIEGAGLEPLRRQRTVRNVFSRAKPPVYRPDAEPVAAAEVAAEHSEAVGAVLDKAAILRWGSGEEEKQGGMAWIKRKPVWIGALCLVAAGALAVMLVQRPGSVPAGAAGRPADPVVRPYVAPSAPAQKPTAYGPAVRSGRGDAGPKTVPGRGRAGAAAQDATVTRQAGGSAQPGGAGQPGTQQGVPPALEERPAAAEPSPAQTQTPAPVYRVSPPVQYRPETQPQTPQVPQAAASGLGAVGIFRG